MTYTCNCTRWVLRGIWLEESHLIWLSFAAYTAISSCEWSIVLCECSIAPWECSIAPSFFQWVLYCLLLWVLYYMCTPPVSDYCLLWVLYCSSCECSTASPVRTLLLFLWVLYYLLCVLYCFPLWVLYTSALFPPPVRAFLPMWVLYCFLLRGGMVAFPHKCSGI